jgi:ribosomal protein L29
VVLFNYLAKRENIHESQSSSRKLTRQKSRADLLAQLKDLKAALSLLCVAKVTGGAPNKLSKMYEPKS